MSNRYAHSSKAVGNNKAFARTQKKFIPKAQDSAPTPPNITNPTLSASLRQSTSESPGDGAAPSVSRVRLGENENWVPSGGGSFVNYLPQDEAVAAGLGAEEGGLDPVESQRVVDLLNRELSSLLKLNPKDFWREVASDVSLHDFLDSFLQFRSRWYDLPHHGAKGIVAGVIVGEFDLSRRVFMVLYRISSNRDPGTQASESLNLKDHAALLQEKKLLNLPKLLEICAIYGHDNQDLTSLLVLSALKSQPGIGNDLTAVKSHFMSIVHAMHKRCSSSLEALLSAGGHEERGSDQLLSDFLEVMDFINDAVISMDAFVCAYRPAAVVFSCPVETSDGNEELIRTLVTLHDSLLLTLQRGFQVIFSSRDGSQNTSSDTLANAALSLKMLSLRIVKFGWKLLEICYLSDEVFDGSFDLSAATKMFPANVEDPGVRADIFIQALRDISGGIAHVQENPRGMFLQSIEKSYGVISRLENLRDTGWIFMDDEQFHYLYGIMAPPLVTKNSTSAPTPMASNKLQEDEDAAIIESKISQIRDLFPDYGKGFLTACLEVYNQNPEEVIQRILEGTLHEDLRSLDTSLEQIPQPKASSSLTEKDKGKGKVSELTIVPLTNLGDVTGKQPTPSPAISSSAPVGRFVRKPRNDVPDMKILDSRDKRDAERTAALVSQSEYEDEYDDSFDDLGLSVGDTGLEETELLGDRMSLSSSLGTETSSQHGSNSKWNSRKKPQFFVKDGKNYSYKVAGSVAVANQNEASIINLAQKETIHGLGRGGNRPLGAVKKLTELSEEQQDDQPNDTEAGGRGNRGGARGRGRRGGGRNHHRKDQAFKKHLTGLGGL